MALAGCGEPSLIFTDRDTCMEVEENKLRQCENIDDLFLAHMTTVQDCIDTLSSVAESCSVEDMCPTGETIFADEPCVSVITLVNECQIN